MKKTVALIVDNPERDLPGLVLVASELAKHDIVSHLVPMNLQNVEVWALAPDFVLLNYLRKSNEEFVRKLIEANISFGCLDTEGGIVSVPVYEATLPDSEDLRRQVSVYFVWGPGGAELVKDVGRYPGERVRVTGSPRFDFYSAPWKQVALKISDYAAEFKEGLVLINGMFALSNPRFRSPEEEARMYVEVFRQEEGAILKAQAEQRRVLEAFAKVSVDLAKRFPSIDFVYRPHPFERLETYQDLLAEATNLYAIQRGTVDGWILRARSLVHYNCSTAVEAGIAGIPAIVPNWLTDLAPSAGMFDRQEAIQEISIRVDSLEELTETVGESLKGRVDISEQIRRKFESVTSKWFGALDGHAHQRVAASVLDVLQHSSHPDLAMCDRLARTRSGGETSVVARGSSFALRTLGPTNYWRLRRFVGAKGAFDAWLNSPKQFLVEDVERILLASDALREGVVQTAAESTAAAGYYRFRFPQGRSLSIRPSLHE